MRLRTPLDVWRLTLLSTVGIASTACGGQASTGSGSDPLVGGEQPSGATTGSSSSSGATTGSGTTGNGGEASTATGATTGTSSGATGSSTGQGTGGESSQGSTTGSTAGAATSTGTGATGGGTAAGGRGGTTTGSVGGVAAVGGEGTGTGAKGGTAATGTGSIGGNDCDGPEQLGGGFVSCTQGFLHRPEAEACVAAPRETACAFAEIAETPACTTDADCTDSPYGHCEPGEQIADCFCTYGCLEDSDCGAGGVCHCGDPYGTCLPATCTTDADCEGGALCASASNGLGTGPGTFQCQTADDECVGDTDCDTGVCGSDGSKKSCQPMIAIGRPFLVAGEQRVADVQQRFDWRVPVDEIRTDHLSPSERQALAAHFSAIGQMEHASVAAFARFALQLLALGAPATLVGQTTSAMADETLHAKLAFELASLYGDRSVGPAAMDLTGALDGSTLEEVTLATVIEGCIGETVAAVEAREVAAHVQDPALRRIFEQIADDETQHSKLAWQFLKWAIARSGPSLARRALALVEQAAQQDVGSADANDDAGAPEHEKWLRLGLVTDATRGEVRRQVLADVVVPCARQLLGTNLRSSDAPTS